MGVRGSDHTPITRICLDLNCPTVRSRAHKKYELQRARLAHSSRTRSRPRKFLLISRARGRVWKGVSHLRLMASARMLGREGPSGFNSWISRCQKRAFALWCSSGVRPARCRRVAMPVLIPNCTLCVPICASRQTVPNHVFCRGLTTMLVPNHVHVPRREDMVKKSKT